MRVGANARQHVQIRKMLKEGVPQHLIARTLRITPQSLEKIVAHIEKRPERVIEDDNNPQIAKLLAENAALRARLGEPLTDEDGSTTIHMDDKDDNPLED